MEELVGAQLGTSQSIHLEESDQAAFAAFGFHGTGIAVQVYWVGVFEEGSDGHFLLGHGGDGVGGVSLVFFLGGNVCEVRGGLAGFEGRVWMSRWLQVFSRGRAEG
jgi:hypothetical protein